MKRRRKTPEELLADLHVFEVAWKRELVHIMRDAVERMVAGARGRREPPPYQVNLPRFTRTVRVDSGRVSSEPILVVPRRMAHLPKDADHVMRTSEEHEFRRSLNNTLKRMRAFRVGRALPPRYKMALSAADTENLQVQTFLDSAHAASDRLLNSLKKP